MVNFHHRFSSRTCDLHFHLNRTQFKLMYRALDCSKEVFDRIVLKEDSSESSSFSFSSSSSFLPIKCNKEQKEAVLEIAHSCGGRPIIIFGFTFCFTFFFAFLFFGSFFIFIFFIIHKPDLQGQGKQPPSLKPFSTFSLNPKQRFWCVLLQTQLLTLFVCNSSKIGVFPLQLNELCFV